MSSAQVILSNKPGPLPISVTYTPESDEKVTLIFSGSVQSHDIAVMQVGFSLEVNGEIIGHSVIASTSSPDQRFATVPAMLSTKLPFNLDKDKGIVEPITFTLKPYSSDSTTSKDDVFNLCVIN